MFSRLHVFTRIFALALLLTGILPEAQGQITGGQTAFRFLALSPSARITGLGGAQIAVRDDDAAFALANPAALNVSMGGKLSFQHNFFLSDIQHGYASYAHHLAKLGLTVHGGLQYMGYGELKQADEFGNILGQIKASESAFTLGAGKMLSERLSLGLNFRFAVSTLDVYQSSALLADAGLMYADTARRITASLVIRNYGAQLATYNGRREAMPNDIQIGFSKRLRYLPFRFSVIAHHLHQWNIRYDDPNADDGEVLLFGEDTNQDAGNPFLDNLFRHLIFNGEFLFGSNENFRIRLGYNHLRKSELSVRNYRSLAGFSAGVGVKVSRFRIDAGYGAYHLAGGVFHLGIGTNLKDFFR
ncbi:MAG: type IX secretion system protein PorQ [Saprospiraceae bacterium]